MQKNRAVKVVELDYESVAYLRENFPALEDNIIEDDFLKLNLEKLFDGKPFVLTGNYLIIYPARYSLKCWITKT